MVHSETPGKSIQLIWMVLKDILFLVNEKLEIKYPFLQTGFHRTPDLLPEFQMFLRLRVNLTVHIHRATAPDIYPETYELIFIYSDSWDLKL